MTDDILRSDYGYWVSADVWPRKAAAARALIEEEVGTPDDWRGILRIARDLDGPVTYRAHLGDEECCGEDEDTSWWYCPDGSGPEVGRYWFIDISYSGLEEASFCFGPEDDES